MCLCGMLAAEAGALTSVRDFQQTGREAPVSVDHVGVNLPWRSLLGKTHITDKSMVVPSTPGGIKRANGGSWRQRTRSDTGSVGARGMATAGPRARSLFHPHGDPSDVRGDAWHFRNAAGLLLLS